MFEARRWIALALLLGLLMVSGCSYAQYRAEDALEMVDVGFTITEEPQIGLYWNSLDIFPFGYSHIDGYFVGLGGGHPLVMRHYNKCQGFGIAYQEIGWGDFDKNDPETLHRNYAGILGYLSPPHQSDPAYSPACVHFFPHIGHVGLVWNARYTEILDFFLGWTTFDLAGDDGRSVGKWFWAPKENEPAAVAHMYSG